MPKIRDTQTGQIIDVPEDKLGDYGIVPVQQQPQQGGISITPDAVQQAILTLPPALSSRIKDAYDIQRQVQADLQEQSKPTAAQEKSKMSKDVAERVVGQLEKLYYGEQGVEDDLAKGRWGGLGAVLKSKLGTNQPVTTYNAARESARPTIARALGDVGNLSQPEQEAAVKLLPTAYSTPEEAEAGFKAIREKLGLSEKEMQSIVTNKDSTNNISSILSSNNGNNNVNSLGKQLVMGLLKKAIKDEFKGIKPGIVNEVINPRASALMNDLSTKGEINPDQLLGVAGEAASNLIPFGKGNLIAKLALSGGVRGVTTPGASVGDRLSSGAGEAALGAVLGGAIKAAPRIFSPVKTAGAAREKLVNGLSEKGVEIGSPDLQKVARDMLDSRVPDYIEKPIIQKLSEGKAITPKEAIDILSKAGSKTFTKGGDFKTNKAAAFYDVLRDAIRKEFETKAPEVLAETTAMAKGYKAEGLLKKILFPAAVGTGVGAGTNLLFRRVTGQ